jgi:hypothetical protein
MVAGAFGITAPFVVNSILLFVASAAVWMFLRDPERQVPPPADPLETVSPTE